MIADQLFYAAAIPAILLMGISKGGFGSGAGLFATPLMALTVPIPQAAAIMLPILIAKLLGLSLHQQAWIGLAAVVGHLYPLYFRFRGGKGVATAAGMLLGLYPPAALLALAAWALVFLLTRTSSLASLIATPLTLPLLAWQQPAALLPAWSGKARAAASFPG